MDGLTPTTETATEAALRVDLAAVHRIFALENLHEGTWTHFSCKLPESGHYLVTPGNTHFSRITASSLLCYAKDGTHVSGDGVANHDAVPIHLPVYAARPDITCILHFHSPHATALTLLKEGRLDTLLSQSAAHFHGKTAYLDSYAIPRTNAEEGEALAAALGDKSVLFLKNHGVLIASDSLDDAVVSAYNLERACRLQLLAMSTGQALARIEESHAAQLAAAPCNGEPGYLTGMKALLDDVAPDYRA
jgi:ribulose-5-phosphate 4-epimerase/fuculose-1-phosphate aldolase